MHTGRDDGPRRTALIVDYDRWNRWWATELLNDRGYAVLDASNGASGLRMAQQNACDVILLAVSLPEMSGPEVLRQLKATAVTRTVPVILLDPRVDEDTVKALLVLESDG
jgi:response regulator RpfG family c-di-GMP phosphodiesterase